MLIGMITFGGINYYRNQVLASEAKKLYMAIILLQNRAIGSLGDPQKKESKLSFNIASNSYVADNDDKIIETLDSNIKFGTLANVFGPPSDPKSPIKQACTFKSNVIKFGANGTICPGTIYMIDKKENNMYAVTVGVAKKSYVRIYKYAKPRWIAVN